MCPYPVPPVANILQNGRSITRAWCGHQLGRTENVPSPPGPHLLSFHSHAYFPPALTSTPENH